MKLHMELRKEVDIYPEGKYAPQYYKYMGMKNVLNESISTIRAEGIKSVFSNTPVHIYKNDLIVGNVRGSYIKDADPILLEHSITFVNKLGRRQFQQNCDHYTPDYRKLVTIGINGMIDEIDSSLKKFKNDKKKTDTLNSMRLTMEGFYNLIKNYAEEAKRQKGNPEYDDKRLDFIIKNCESLLSRAPQNFSEALQLTYLCHTAFLLLDMHNALGRMDQYLYPFYKNDIEKGILKDEDVIELLENVFEKIAVIETFAGFTAVINICIGGMNEKGECEVNGLSYCIIEAVKNVGRPGPNLSARITRNTPDEFLDAALKSIGTGIGYPALMNDEINIAALKKYGYKDEDVYDYCMVGCIENVIAGKQPPWTDGRFDTPRYLDYVFNNGKSKFNKSVGLDLGDVENIKSMNDFMKNFEEQLKFGVQEYFIKFESENNFINQEFFPEPFISCFCRGCASKGLDVNNGGSMYPSVHGVGLMGIGTVSDSLAAIEKVVFVDKEATLTDIKNALNSNFEGYDGLRKKLISAPKYGNDDDFVDKYAVWFVKYLSSLFMEYKTRDGGGIYTAIAANTSNIPAGKIINATPDGRLCGEPLSDAASPTYGKDINGATATFNSLSKPDYTLVATGSVVNQKFSPSMFEGENRKKLLSLIKTYFKKGGQEIQINSTSRKILEDAMHHPENYKDLVVRVSGFSEYYTRLSKAVQEDILSRTQKS